MITDDDETAMMQAILLGFDIPQFSRPPRLSLIPLETWAKKAREFLSEQYVAKGGLSPCSCGGFFVYKDGSIKCSECGTPHPNPEEAPLYNLFEDGICINCGGRIIVGRCVKCNYPKSYKK